MDTGYNQFINELKKKAGKWTSEGFDEETRKEVTYMIEKDERQLIESFYKDLEFGTGGLRGLMGVGTNRVNKYTVGMATQGLSNYMNNYFSDRDEISVVIAHDSRNNSRFFAEITAGVFAANEIKVYLFDDLRPSPELSFAIRHLKCQGGVVITASHNPREYNGYKAYWEHGGQIISPQDKKIIEEVSKIKDISEVKFDGPSSKIIMIGEEIDKIYIEKIKELSLSPEIIKKYRDLSIVYTPIHGTGIKLIPRALNEYGFTNVIDVPAQNIPDGNFPTVISPNPEDSAAMNMAIRKARETNAELVMATDPDGDRVGIAVRDQGGEFILLNGNQTGTLLFYYLLTKWHEKNLIKGKEYIVKTIVTTDLIANIAKKYDILCYDVLTGFKYIADIMNQNEGKKTFICGAEESYGYLVGDFVRDKDAVIACALIAEAAAWAKSQKKSFHDLLIDIYIEFGFYKEQLISITKKGKEGADEIQKLMERFRNAPPVSLAGSEVVLIHDFLKQKTVDTISNLRHDINLPKSNVLQYITKDGTKVSIRPSGTEPKIKFYFSVKGELDKPRDYHKVNDELEDKIEKVLLEMNITG
ncbi:MAG: phospho-sugar mutase [Bacteroidota bacterium]